MELGEAMFWGIAGAAAAQTAFELARSALRGRLSNRNATGTYWIVDRFNGRAYEGPLTLRQAVRAQKRWHNLFTWHDGPWTDIAVKTSTRDRYSRMDGKK